MGLWATFPQHTALNKISNMTFWEKKETTNLTLKKKSWTKRQKTRQNKKRKKRTRVEKSTPQKQVFQRKTIEWKPFSQPQTNQTSLFGHQNKNGRAASSVSAAGSRFQRQSSIMDVFVPVLFLQPRIVSPHGSSRKSDKPVLTDTKWCAGW